MTQQRNMSASTATAPTFTPGAAAHNTASSQKYPAAPSDGAAQPIDQHPKGSALTVDDGGIRDVCADNLEEEFALMCNVMDEYNYVAIDTEFPGIVLEPFAEHIDSISTWNYAQLRDNVNALKLIQLGISFSNEKGETPKDGPCWQFNFQFDLGQDMYASDAIDLLTNSMLNFEVTKTNGIKPEVFGEMLMSSGLVLNENIHWISFHGLYDFGYILKVLTSSPLPPDPDGYFEALSLFFPRRCDIKYLLREEGAYNRGGLSSLGDRLGCLRQGQCHQGGSDAMLTLDIFHALKEEVKASAFDASNDDCGGLFGLSNEERHAYHPFFNKQQQQAAERQARDAAAAANAQYTSPPRDERPGYGYNPMYNPNMHHHQNNLNHHQNFHSYPQHGMPYQGSISPMYSSQGPVQQGQDGMYLQGYQQTHHVHPNVVNGGGNQMWRNNQQQHQQQNQQMQQNGQQQNGQQQYDDGSGGRQQGVMVTS